MKKWLIITGLFFFVSMFYVCASYRHPSEDTVKKEFSLRNPNTEVINMKLIFDEVAVAAYEVEYKDNLSEKISIKQITLHQCINWDWKSDYKECDRK
jgi:hypothetical protein